MRRADDRAAVDRVRATRDFREQEARNGAPERGSGEPGPHYAGAGGGGRGCGDAQGTRNGRAGPQAAALTHEAKPALGGDLVTLNREVTDDPTRVRRHLGADAVQERREGLERGAGISELELLGLAAQPRGCTSARGEARGSEAESGDDLERALRHLTGSTGRQCTGFQPRLELRSALRRRTLPWNEQRQQASYRCGVRLRNEHSPYELRFSVPSGRDPASGCEDGARGGTSRARLSNATPGSVPETMSRSTPRHKPT